MIPQFKRLLLLFTLALSLASCSSGNENLKTVASTDTFKSYAVDVTTPAADLFDYIERVEVLGLEETEESLLSFVSKASILEDYLVFQNGYKNEAIIYTREGNYKQKISRQGPGPEEYSSIWSIWASNQTVNIYGGQKLVSYDFNGNYIKSGMIDQKLTHIYGYKDGYVAAITNPYATDSLKYSVGFIDANLERTGLAAPYENPKNGGIVWYLNTFSKYEDEVLYQNGFGDTIYTIKERNAVPLLSIDFGTKWLWKDIKLYTDSKKQTQAMAEDNMVKMFFTSVSREQLFFTTLKHNGSFLVDRASGNYKRFDLKKDDQSRYQLNPQGWDGDRMVFNISSSDIRQFLSELSPDKAKFKGSDLEVIEASENPVLIWVKFKDGF